MQRISLIFAGIPFLLVACTATPSTPQATTEQQPLSQIGSIYQINFVVPSAGQTQVALHTLNPQGMKAQTLRDAPDAISFGEGRVAIETFVTRKNGIDIRHIHSTFIVTNTSSQTLKNLVFLPVIIADSDNDPSNNPYPVTVAGTPFTKVQYFDGSDASAVASSIQPTQAQYLDVQTGTSVNNTAASPYLNGLDVSQLTTDVPAGMSSTIQNSGWLAAPTLAPGASTTLNLAVDLPVDLNLPASQPFSFSMLLTVGQET